MRIKNLPNSDISGKFLERVARVGCSILLCTTFATNIYANSSNTTNISLLNTSNVTSVQSHDIQNPQKEKVTGIVKDDKGEPLIGVSVVASSTGQGGLTNVDGKFTITAIQGDMIKFSYVGYQPVTMKFTGKPMDVIMKEDSKILSEVVVVGYSTQKKENLTGSVASITNKKLQDRPIQNLTNGLQGLAPGLTISGTNGAPGMDNGQIRVRGTGTLNNASPYILIDGVEAGTLNALDPNDIASISILKDAASAAIYGSKASNGVILVTTKRGMSGKPRVSYSGYVSFQNATCLVDRLSSYDYASMLNGILEADGKTPKFTPEQLQKFKNGNDPAYPDTNWYDLAYKTGVMHRHNVNITGGTEGVRYMASVGYLNQEGIMKNASREQVNARTNLDLQITSKLNAHLNLAYIKNQYSDPSSAYLGGSSDQLIRQLNLVAPWIVSRYPDGTWGTVSDGNPIAWLDNGLKVNRDNHNFTGIGKIDYDIIDGLKFSITGSYIGDLQNYNYFQKYFRYNATKDTEPSYLDDRFYIWSRKNFDALLNYEKAFGEHHLKGLLGWHTEDYNYKEEHTYRKNFPNNDLTDLDAGDVSTQTNKGFTRQLKMLSWFGRINYDFAGKYLFEANLRADGSSRFSKGHRWGYFPSFSAAWRLSQEAFMENTAGWLSDMKIRASWGILGNQEALTDFYPALDVYGLKPTYPFNEELRPGFAHDNYRLSTVSWERSTNWGIGLDFALFKNKVSGTIDYYNRKTTGIIMDVSVPREFALGAYKDNVGAMRNSGLEVTLAYNDTKGDWTWGASGNFAYNKNRILDLGDVAYMDDGTIRNAVNHSFKSYYIYKTDGFFNSQQEADEFTAKFGNPFGGGKFKAGDLRYVDANGDGKLNGDDRVMCNSTEPVYTFALNLNAGWKNFDLSLMFSGQAKASRLYDAYEVEGAFLGDSSHPATIWKKAWSETNKDHAKMPRLFYGTDSPSSARQVNSSFWLYSTDFIRLKNLQFGYNLPKSLITNWGLSNLRIYYSAENLFTIDRMRINVDPEATSGRLSSYPLLRTHSVGVNVTF
ncbi:TonB-dependent receptor [Porphyromonas pogonae]|uniref:SusC/RagA family TonB-linked outer membrane protein n=1 Tax=Porphyromonas pogonae TaxID=867595 RepID=UPI002E79EDCC|nr:TonB-dependent receptor [Porphyromonas pogonae]